MSDLTAPAVVSPAHDLAGVLRIPAFRRLWVALSLSSLGDWLGLLATTALAQSLASSSYAAANFAIAGVFILRLAPAVVIGPIAGVVADRLDRRWTMVICDVLRFSLFASIPLVGTLLWLYVATFLVEAVSLMWIPAKEATVPNLVPRDRLETANQLSLFTTYGSAPVAAALFAGLSLFNGVIGVAIPALAANPNDLALYFDAATFLFSAFTIYRLREIPSRGRTSTGQQPSVWRTLVDGWSFVGHTPVVRGLLVGMLGAFAAAGAVIGLARTFVRDLGAGNPGYGVLFAAVFLGMAAGMFAGPRLLSTFSRRRMLGLAIIAAGFSLALLALIPHMVAAVLITLAIGAWGGIAWVTGYTLLGLEVSDEVRGRTFALLQTLVRVTLVLVLAVAPLLAAALGQHALRLTRHMTLTYNGAALTFLVAGLLAAAVGVASYRQMDDRRGIPLRVDLAAAWRGEAHRRAPVGGFFLALEGGEGAGKSTQARLLASWLEDKGFQVVRTHEPGATRVGRRLRDVLLAAPALGLTPRAEALLFAADRAEHVASVIRPALQQGAIVLTDRYVDSSVAYQGAGRALPPQEIEKLSAWATEDLLPDLTIVLDIPPQMGLQRGQEPADRLEAEPPDFHERVRRGFLQRAQRQPRRYVVVDASRPVEAVFADIRQRVTPLIPSSPRDLSRGKGARGGHNGAETVGQEAEERARREAEERARREAEERARREAEEKARREAENRARREAEKARREEVKARREAEQRARREAEQARREAQERSRREAAEQARREAAEKARREAKQKARSAGRTDPHTQDPSLIDELFALGSLDDDPAQPLRGPQDQR